MQLESLSIHAAGKVHRNLAPAALYEAAVRCGDAEIVSSGALAARSGEKTGRSPKDKRIVQPPIDGDDVWWGEVNIQLEESVFNQHRRRAVEYLSARNELYVVDGFVGWDREHRIKVRVVCARAYHALFMWNMLIRPTAEELAEFGQPEFTILNAGAHPAEPTPGHASNSAICLDFKRRELVILGTEYAGEMKKGVFTLMHYLMPTRGVLSMHCSANESPRGEVSLFFGLSGTGKTTLSADPRRRLIGDDEHCWTDRGVFNIEGGCYAKCINLSPEKEPQIYSAIRFGTVLENVVYDPATRVVDYADASITENTRAAYPIEHIPNARIPCLGGHPRHVIFLTCDAFGVLPPVSRLTTQQAMYHFLSGYTAKVAGTEVGVTEPKATFSACFGAAFLVWRPTRYARMLADRLQRHDAQAWLVNTGWIGGGYGQGKRIALSHTRAILDCIHDGALRDVPTEEHPVFGLQMPTRCAGVPPEVLIPWKTWPDREQYDRAAEDLARRFAENFDQYHDEADMAAGGPTRTA